MKKITVDFTGFILDKDKSYYTHNVYRKGDEYILVLYYENEDYCEVKNIHFEDKEIVEDEDICVFDFYDDLVKYDDSLVQGPLEAFKY